LDISLAGLGEIERAFLARAPELSELVCALARAQEPPPPSAPSALTWNNVRHQVRSQALRQLAPEDRRQRRVMSWRAVEQDATVPLPDRYRLHEVLMRLWQDGSAYARQQLLRIIAQVPLRHGPWRGLKRIFKEAEARSDWEIYGALAARLDAEHAHPAHPLDVDTNTLGYLVRRAWRTLRYLGHRLPAAYPDAAAEVLRHYPPQTRFEATWVANQIFFHEDGGAGTGRRRAYSRASFRRTHYTAGQPSLQHLAFAEAWRRSPRPLFGLLERASSETVRAFASEALKTSFRTQLREAEPGWVVRLTSVGSPSLDRFVVWLLDNLPRFEPGAFRELGLHEPVLGLLLSGDASAAAWAARYARTHARDLPLQPLPGAPVALLPLANSPYEPVRLLARDLLQDRDPRAGVGLGAWGELLGTSYGHALAAHALQEHFSARELTLDWFHERLLSTNGAVVTFARELLPKVHPERSIPTTFWASILDDPNIQGGGASHLGSAALDALQERAQQDRALDDLDPDVLRRALLHPGARSRVMAWVREGRASASKLGVEWLQAIAYPRSWEANPWIEELLRSGRPWVQGLKFDDTLSAWALELLGDERNFSGRELGFDWLVDLAERSVPRYHRFASEVLARSFRAEDFAPDPSAPDAGEAGAQRLWEMATGPGPADAPLRRFALYWLRRHHADIHLAETDTELEPEAALPPSFFTFERAHQLAADSRAPLRELGLLWLKWELARMAPPMEQIASLCELPWPEVRAFVELALTADESLVHQRYRLDPATLSVEGVYRFCESLDPATRALGMKLISQHERLVVPEELFRLTQSPDRQVRAFVMRQLWRLYRDRPSSEGFEPRPLARPDGWPAPRDELGTFLRRSLFEIPPGRGASAGVLPARRAKLALIEVCRDLALEDRAFAERVRPLFEEFLRSRGKSESMACLVAITRIRARWGALA
jgi:hypothetical protein